MASTYEAKFSITNIDSEDFVGYNGGEPYPLKAGETREFPKFIAEHLAKHLLDRILQERHHIKNTFQDTAFKKGLLYQMLPWKEEDELLNDKEKMEKRRQVDAQVEVKKLQSELETLKKTVEALTRPPAPPAPLPAEVTAKRMGRPPKVKPPEEEPVQPEPEPEPEPTTN